MLFFLCALSSTTRPLTTFSAHPLCSSPRRSRTHAALSWQSTFYFGCWMALRFRRAAFDYIFSLSYSFEYSSFFYLFLLGPYHAYFTCIRKPCFAAFFCTPFGLVSPSTQVHPASRPHDTYIPQLACYAGHKRHTFVELYCLLRAHSSPLPPTHPPPRPSLTPPAFPFAKTLAIVPLSLSVSTPELMSLSSLARANRDVRLWPRRRSI